MFQKGFDNTYYYNNEGDLTHQMYCKKNTQKYIDNTDNRKSMIVLTWCFLLINVFLNLKFYELNSKLLFIYELYLSFSFDHYVFHSDANYRIVQVLLIIVFIYISWFVRYQVKDVNKQVKMHRKNVEIA